MPKFNGYKNWNHWNVALWLSNDKDLYRNALNIKRYSNGTATVKANQLLNMLHALGITHPPYGAPPT